MPLAYALAMIVVSIIINVALSPKPAGAKAATFGDFDLPVAEDGTPQVVYFGENWTESWQVLAYGNFRTKKVKAKNAKK